MRCGKYVYRKDVHRPIRMALSAGLGVEAANPSNRLSDMMFAPAFAKQEERVIRQQRIGRISTMAHRHATSCCSSPPGRGDAMIASLLAGELGLALVQVARRMC